MVIFNSLWGCTFRFSFTCATSQGCLRSTCHLHATWINMAAALGGSTGLLKESTGSYQRSRSAWQVLAASSGYVLDQSLIGSRTIPKHAVNGSGWQLRRLQGIPSDSIPSIRISGDLWLFSGQRHDSAVKTVPFSSASAVSPGEGWYRSETILPSRDQPSRARLAMARNRAIADTVNLVTLPKVCPTHPKHHQICLNQTAFWGVWGM